MAQGGFAFFFLAVLIGCSFALGRWVQLHWARIAAAARGQTAGEARPVNYRSVQRRPIDLPYVARRMLPADRSLSEPQARRWPVSRPARPSGYQLAFGF